MKNLRLLLFAAIAVLMTVSCDRNPYQGFDKAENGVYIKYYQRGNDTVKPQVGDRVYFSMVYSVGDSVFFSSSEMPAERPFPMREPDFEGDLYSALSLLNIGDSVTIVFPVDSLYVDNTGQVRLEEGIESGDLAYFDIKLNRIVPKDEVEAEYRAILMQHKEQETELWNEYFSKKENKGGSVKESGLVVIEDVKGKGELPKLGDYISASFSIATLDGMEIFTTFNQEPLEFPFGQPVDTKGFNEGVGYLKAGSKARLVLPSNLAFDSTGFQQMIPPYTPLLYTVQVFNIRSKADYDKEMEEQRIKAEKEAEIARTQETDKIQKYILTNEIGVAPTESGLYFVDIEVGDGKAAEVGKSITAHYTLYNIEGVKIESSLDRGEPFTFTLDENNVIPAWVEAIPMMKEGGKAKVIAPSSLAYGETAVDEKLPAYSPLVFEIELIKVE